MPGTPREISYLEDRFQTGDKPTQQEFYDLFASFVHFSQKYDQRLKEISFGATVNLHENVKATHQVAGAIAYIKGAEAHKVGNIRYDYLTADGINKPTFSADFVVVWDNWLNTINSVNRIRFEYLPSGKIAVDIRWIE